MNIVCVGGGPAGLYFAILMKLARSEHEVTVFERRSEGSRVGWGVVFWDDLVDDLRASDPITARHIADAAFRWHGQLLDLQGERSEFGGAGYGIGRSQLLEILVARAREVGVVVRFDAELESDHDFEADVVVAADGANSTLREREAERYGTESVLGRNKYVWLGTRRPIDPFTFAFVRTQAGWIWCHAYAFDEGTSTFIVECPPETWSQLGFASLNARDSLDLLEQLFAPHLDGARLETLRGDESTLPWLTFRTITNAHWYSGNTVLVGDAAHTTHFSIGSGTRLALQDAITLAAELDRRATPREAFAAYERNRRGALLRPQAEARFSAQFFESIDRYADLPADELFVLLRARRDPLLPRLPPKLYYVAYSSFERSAALRAVRGWIGPKLRTLYGRFRRHAPSAMTRP